MTGLVEVPLAWQPVPLPARVEAFAAEGLRRSRAIDCFDFVPSECQTVHSVLDSLGRCRFCEWGSGIGIVTGMAAMLGFEAWGIEICPALADASRILLQDFGLQARIETGNYLQMSPAADLYFVYCWPGETARVEAHFLAVAPPSARLLYCSGAAQVRCLCRAAGNDAGP